MPNRSKELVAEALRAKKRAHTPYSMFPVGAALLASNGHIYTGCNIEVSSYGLTICAERTAIFKAVSEGDRNFKAIAIVSDDPNITPPCGACRQVLWDLAGNIDVIMANPKGKIKKQKLKDLIPHAFDSRNLERTLKQKR
ncbi:MAG: cytidine deaminase [Ignavibacteriae bacterium]|nr:cytidine deaminase [Ignavibacteriota bacterium]